MRLRRHPAVGRPSPSGSTACPIPALEGETIAAALSAAGIVAFRRTASGAPRGLHCGMGACFDCVVTVDGRIGQRACMTKVADGMVVTGEPALPLAPLGARTGHARRPRNRCATCWWSAPGRPGCRRPSPRPRPAHRVVVLDERSATGGQYAKPLRRQPRRCRARSRSSVSASNCAIARLPPARASRPRPPCGAASPSDEIAALVGGRAVTFRPRRLVLAPGAHERPVPLPGWTLPGVMTTGALQTLVRAQRVCPGERVLIAGSGPLNLQLACELLAGGRETAGRGGGGAAALARPPGARPGPWRAPRRTWCARASACC